MIAFLKSLSIGLVFTPFFWQWHFISWDYSVVISAGPIEIAICYRNGKYP